MVLSTHRLEGRIRVFYLVFLVFAAVVVVGGATSAVREDEAALLVFLALWTLGVVVQAWFFLRRMPQRIEVLDHGLRFCAPSRTREVPWSALRSVASPAWDLNGQSLRWRWEGGSLWTWRQYDDLRALINTVEERAPQAALRGV